MPVQIRFNDIDLLGHLNNSVYFEFMDLAKTEYFITVLGHPVRWGDSGIVIVNVNCDFLAPSFFEDRLEVETSVVAIGNKSLTLEQHVFSPSDGVIRCQCRTVMSGYNKRTLKSEPISDKWRKAIEAYEEGIS